MASDNFLQIDGIKGESTDDKHKDWIEVLSFNWGVAQMASAAAVSATSSSAGERADFQDLSITKLMDKSSPMLMKNCAEGKPVKEVILELCRATGSKVPYMEIKLQQVIISSVSTGGGGGGEATESVTFNYGKITETYTPFDRDGKAQGKVPAGWDLTKNKPI